MSVPARAVDAPEVPGDGRLARRDRNRIAVLDAAIELFAEGVLDPTPDDVATRAGISARSVYRYFEAERHRVPTTSSKRTHPTSS